MTPAATLKFVIAAIVRCGGCLAVASSVLLAAGGFSASAQPTLSQSAVSRTMTLDAVKRRGNVHCGVDDNVPGFSAEDAKGAWTGFSVDFCRALAAAIFDDPSKVVLIPLTAANGFAPLVSGAIDVLVRGNTWTLTREAGLGIQFAFVGYYDGQGFMVHKSHGASSARDLNDTKVCVQRESTSELNLADYFRANKLNYEEVSLPSEREVVEAYDQGRCDVITSDISRLHAERLQIKSPDDHVILPDTISKEPLGPAVRDTDAHWLNVVKWTHYAMVNAEELGVTQKTLPMALESDKAEIKRLLGSYAALGEALGLSNDWAVRIIRHVGNYGEVFERNLGAGSRLAIPRGLNRLWTNGGLQYAPPMR